LCFETRTTKFFRSFEEKCKLFFNCNILESTKAQTCCNCLFSARHPGR
jgi:hypothetical protein